MQVKISGLYEILYHYQTFKPKFCISLLDIGVNAKEALGFKGENHLILHFEDYDKRWAHSSVAPKLDDIQKIVDFARNIGPDDKVLVNCHAGVSRSAATAIGILVQHGMHPADAILYCKEIRPQMWPNDLITEYFSEVLGVDISTALEMWMDTNNYYYMEDYNNG